MERGVELSDVARWGLDQEPKRESSRLSIVRISFPFCLDGFGVTGGTGDWPGTETAYFGGVCLALDWLFL